MKVELELKNGKNRKFHPEVAKVLVARGLGKELGYQTRELRAEAPKAPDELAALKAEADKRGIKYHHRAGVAKLRELLEG
jgi:hypothetical protein